MKSLKKISISTIFIGTFIFSETFHIATTGSDEVGDGSQLNPFATIQCGIDASSNGDTVLVQPGTYVENINYNGKNITVGSLTLTTEDTSYISQTIIDGNQSGRNITIPFFYTDTSSLLLNGFTLIRGFDPIGNGLESHAILIEDNENFGGDSIAVEWLDIYHKLQNLKITNYNVVTGTLIRSYSTNITISSSEIYENYGSDYLIGLYAPNIEIIETHIHNNTGMITTTQEGSSVVLLNSVINANIDGYIGYFSLILNSTIANNDGWIDYNLNPSPLIIINSIITQNSICEYWVDSVWEGYTECALGVINYVYPTNTWNDQPGGGIYISNSIITGLEQDSDVPLLFMGENVFSTEARLNLNLQLYEDSPGIGMGSDSVLIEYFDWEIEDVSLEWFYAPTTDIDGNPRPNPAGSNPDIGAYESPLAEPQLPYTMATFETDGSIIGGLTMLDENTLYAVSSNDKVYRLDGNLNYYYFLDVDGEIKSASTVTSDHNVYIASTDQNLYSFNASGITNDDWPRTMGSEVTASVAVDGDGNLYIGTENGIFQAVSPTNESLWASNLGAAVYASACISIDNKLYIPISDGRIICYNLNTINPASPMFEWLLPTGSGIVSSPALDEEGNIYVGTLDGRLIKVQDNGNSASIVWEVVTDDSIIASPIIDGNGNVLVGSNDGFFYSVGSEGTINWTVDTGGKVRSTAAIGGNGNIYFGSDDYKLYAVDSLGTVQWNYYASSPISSPVLASGDKIYFGEENGLVVKLTENSNRTISRNQPMWGTFQGNNKRTGSQSDSNLSNENSISIPTQFTLHQNYPNPFNPTTTLKYDLPQDALVSISIYDVMGRKIKSLSNANQVAGYHSLQWDATNNIGEGVSAGMYIYTIQAGEYRATKKMVLLK